MSGKDYKEELLNDTEIYDLLTQTLARANLGGKRVLITIPDGTRTAPISKMFRLFYETLGKEVTALDYLIALGTDQRMSEKAINERVGLTYEERVGKYAKVNIFHHRWDLPETFVALGRINEAEIEEITDSLIRQAVDVRLNKMVFDYDQINKQFLGDK